MSDSNEVSSPPPDDAAATAMSNKHAAFGSETAEQAGGRERWNSRIGFYLAAIGSAVGFGNVWR